MKSMTICFLLLIFTAATGKSESTHQASHELPAIPVHTISVQETTTLPQVELVATIEAVRQAAISAKVTGTIIELPVVLGSRVEQGDILAQISAEEISARVLQAQAQLAQARRNLLREQKLLKRNATTRETVNSLRDMFKIAQATLKEAQTMLGYATIKAPFTGVITRKLANNGDLATPGAPLLRLEDDTSLQAVTAVPESLLQRIATGDSLTVIIPSAAAELTGTVAEIAPAADPRSRTARVKINIPYSPALRTGQFARIALPAAPATSLFVPTSAVIPFGQMDKVFVVENGYAMLRLVRTGRHTDKKVEILAGITPGDNVITDNNSRLISGQPVTVTQ